MILKILLKALAEFVTRFRVFAARIFMHGRLSYVMWL